ncbi:MAG: hypothetical protein QGG62_06305, partial [Candidatus Poseidoniaceae archaeon]|nr:hypothetical protein [Candidatus Poseidoniaceae archaeon]
IRVFKKTKKNELQIIDSSIFIKDAQMDGAVVYNDYILFTRHCSVKRCGIISIYKISENKLTLIDEIMCEEFPHGIDVYNDKIAYTSYAKSALIMIDFPNLKST